MGRTRKRKGTGGATSDRNGRAEPAALSSADSLQKLRGYLISSAAGSKRRRKALRSDVRSDSGLDGGACGDHADSAGGLDGAGAAGARTSRQEPEGEAAGRAEAEGADPPAVEELRDGDGEGGGDAGEESGGAAEWRCAAYSRHFGSDWVASSLDALEASRQTLAGKLPGIGDTEAVFAPTAGAPFPPPGMARQADEDWMRACGVLAPIRRAWLGKLASASPAATTNANAPAAAAAVAVAAAQSPTTARARPAMPAAGRSAYHAMASYRDFYHPAAGLLEYEDGPRGGGLMRAAALHAAQHALVVTRERLRAAKKGQEGTDRGFTRPTVLVLLPFRSHALAFMEALMELLPDAIEQVENKSRFLSEFGEADGAPTIAAAKPQDHRALFRGNSDDCFRCGVRFARKAVKLFAHFYKADLVVASPLGLRLGLGAEGEASADADWLSSIEVVMLLHTDVFLMQNIAHLSRVMELLNTTPTETRDTDFSRVRPYLLDGLGGRLRQTIMLARHDTPQLRGLALRQCRNAVGRLVVNRPCTGGGLAAVPAGTRQLFLRFDAASPAAVDDARLEAFKDRLLPALLRAMGDRSTPAGRRPQTLLFAPSYFDFVRLRSLLHSEDIPFTAISEYSEPSDVARARAALGKGEMDGMLLYTERAHFFRRHLLRGRARVAFYGVPAYEHFYPEIVQMLAGCGARGGARATGGAGVGEVVALFCRFDWQPLRRLVGDERAAAMVGGGSATSFLFQ